MLKQFSSFLSDHPIFSFFVAVFLLGIGDSHPAWLLIFFGVCFVGFTIAYIFDKSKS